MQAKSSLADARRNARWQIAGFRSSIQKGQIVRSRFPHGAGDRRISVRPASVAGRVGLVQAHPVSGAKYDTLPRSKASFWVIPG